MDLRGGSRRIETIFFWLILTLVIGLRFLNVDRGLSGDEGWLFKAAQLDLKDLGNYLKFAIGSLFPPLSPILLHFWMKVSSHEIWVRSYFILFGTGLSVLMYYLGRLYIHRRLGLWVFFLSACSPLLISMSQLIRSYIDTAFWMLLSVYCLLRMVKLGFSWKRGWGYVLSSLLALYSGYISAFVLLGQNIFVLIFYFRDFRFIKRWLCMQLITLCLFLPCLYWVYYQTSHITAMSTDWSQRGFIVLGLKLGLYARGIAASLGLDPWFLTLTSLREQFETWQLLGLAGMAFGLLVWFAIKAVGRLKATFQSRRLIWFFPLILLGSLLIHALLVEVIHFPVTGEYFIVPHVLVLMIMAAVFSKTELKPKLEWIAFMGLMSFFILRIPEAVKPEWEVKKASHYLIRKAGDGACLLAVSDPDKYGYLRQKAFQVIMMQPYLKSDSVSRNYGPLDQKAEQILRDVKQRYKEVWFHRKYGNDEILKGNKLIMDWLKQNDYKIQSTQRFKRIDIVYYRSD